VSLVLVLVAPMVAWSANESPQTFTLDGQLFQSGTTTPLLDAAAKIKVQILNPAGTCILYEEQQTVNTLSTDGHFTVYVGSAAGSAKRTVNDAGRTMIQIFQNFTAITANSVPGQTCTGGFYTPMPGDVRYFRIIVTPSASNVPDTLIPDMVLDSVPQAIVAQSVQGLERTGILQSVSSGSTVLTQANLEAAFTTPAYTNLQSILAGNFIKTDTSGATLPSYAADPVGVSNGDIWFDTATNQVKYKNASGVQVVGSGGGTSTDITTALGYTPLGPSTVFAGDISGTYNAIVLNKVPVSKGGTNVTSFGNNRIVSTNGTGTALIDFTCSLNQVITFDASGNATCANVSSLAAMILNGGNTTAGDISIGTNDNQAFSFKANNTIAITISQGGQVGVGTTTPAAKLDVAGDLKVGDSGSTCSVTTKGSIRYNNTSSVLEFCNGTSWNLVQAAACSDATPAVFSFSNEANATVSTLYTSDIIQVTGINCTVPVTISGAGTPQFQICSDAGCGTVVQGWTSSPSSIVSGQYIQARLTTDAVGGAQFQATVIVGSGATVWSVTNAGGDCTASPSIGTVCADGTIYAGLSPDGNVKMFTSRCDAGQTWDGSNCTGVRSTIQWNSGSTSYISTGVTSTTAGKTNSATLSGLADSNAPYQAAQYCESLNLNGNTDWYLPAHSELGVLYSGKAAIRNFDLSNQNYWSSSELGQNIAYYLRMSDGTVNYNGNPKSYSYNVRCVRR